jgi:sodium/proline symporter
MAATIAVPAIVGNGMSASAALFGAGVGTIIYQLFTKFRSPVFLGSSFAFIGSMSASFAGAASMSMGYFGLLAGAIFAGLVLAGILAATMSTADSQLLAASSSASQNIVTEFFGVKLSRKKSMLVARGTVLVIAVLGVLLALDQESSVFKIVSFAWAGFGAAFGPLVLLALFWKNSNMWGALSGMIAGGVMVFVWKFLLAPLGGVWAIYELLPAFLLGLLINVVVSLATGGQKDHKILETFDEVAAKKKA